MNDRSWFFEWIEEWSQFWTPCNWYTFHPILIEFEDERVMGGVEFTIIVMGIGVRFRWNHTKTEMVERIRDELSKIDESSGRIYVRESQ